jgi:hypothetical protein
MGAYLQPLPHSKRKQQERIGIDKGDVAKVKLVRFSSNEHIEHLIDRLDSKLRHGLYPPASDREALLSNVTPQSNLLLKTIETDRRRWNASLSNNDA